MKPEIGMSVCWYPGGDPTQSPYTAIVTKVNPHTLCLHVMSPEIKNFLIKDGVRHLADKTAKVPELQEQGAWDYAPWLKNLLQVAAELSTSTPQKKAS